MLPLKVNVNTEPTSNDANSELTLFPSTSVSDISIDVTFVSNVPSGVPYVYISPVEGSDVKLNIEHPILFPDEPCVPDIPDVPEVPDIPDVPDVPLRPDVPDVPFEPPVPPVPPLPTGGSNVAFLIVIVLPSHFM